MPKLRTHWPQNYILLCGTTYEAHKSINIVKETSNDIINIRLSICGESCTFAKIELLERNERTQ